MPSIPRQIRQHRAKLASFSIRWRAAMAVLCGCSVIPVASAALSDTLHPFAGLTYSTDDNLFRVPDGVSPGPEGRSDTIRETMFGMQLERPLGRERIEANVKLSKVDFGKYKQLNYSGENADATLFWNLLNTLSGTVGGAYAQTLAPYSDFHSTERNLRVQRDAFGELNWRFHPSWRLHGRYAQTEFSYDLSSQQYLNRTERVSEAGIDYLASSGSTIGLLARRSKGDYTNQQTQVFLSNEDYTQDAIKLKVLWLLSAQSMVEFLGGHTRRSHDDADASQRDASGTNGRLTVTWSPRTTVKIISAGWREFTPFEGALTSYSLNRGASIRGSWDVLDRLRVEAQVQSLHRDFNSPQIGGVTLFGFGDDTQTGSLGVTYVFHDHLTVGASVNRDKRSIDSRYGSAYRSTGATMFANLQF